MSLIFPCVPSVQWLFNASAFENSAAHFDNVFTAAAVTESPWASQSMIEFGIGAIESADFE
ncbi:MAG TPA: hypothetical protein DCF63_21040 [Planctomycetaceae bacterium]|nr:hypothetical protein [Planctomycetaceae bacterium]